MIINIILISQSIITMCILPYSFIYSWITPVTYFYLSVSFNAFWKLHGVQRIINNNSHMKPVTSLRLGKSEKLKSGRKYGAGTRLLKRGVVLFLLKVYHFYIVLLFAKLCYANEEKNFSSHHNFMKNVILSCLKLSLKTFHESR